MIFLSNNIHAKESLHFTYVTIDENVNFPSNGFEDLDDFPS